MPELTFSVRWPDGRVEDCYSPSLVVHDHLRVGETYTVGDFARRTAYALSLAGDRVRDTYGFACSSAAATCEQVRRGAAAYADDDLVEVVAMHPSLPAAPRPGTPAP